MFSTPLIERYNSTLWGSCIFDLWIILEMGRNVSYPFAWVQGFPSFLAFSWSSLAVISIATQYPENHEVNSSLFSPYFTPSQDQFLHKLAWTYEAQYITSTSSFTGIMSHVYWLLSNFKQAHFSNLSFNYDSETTKFMASQWKPDSVYLRKVGDTYAIDSDQGFMI